MDSRGDPYRIGEEPAIHGMDVQVDGISEAAGGAGGLSDLAETLHADIASFADITKA